MILMKLAAWNNLPASTSVNEDETAERVLTTASATDPVGEAITYDMLPKEPSVPFKIANGLFKLYTCQ